MTGRVITFYSYKGGVGRTFVLANTAALLAEWGWRVLCVDFDLEAPGLAPYFELDPGRGRRPDEPHPGGLVDLLLARQTQVDGPRWQDLVRRVSFAEIDGVLPPPLTPKPDPRGHIDLLDAGAPGLEFTAKLRQLDWQALFSEGPDLGNTLETWRAEWRRAYDVILIDSRTGLTDIQGITTAQLPDVVVFLFTGNRQSVDGSLQTIELSLRQQAALPYGRLPPWIVPLPARFDARVEPQGKHWLGQFAKEFATFYEPWRDGIPTARLPELLRIDYHPRWSFDERIAVRTESITDPSTISAQLARVAAGVARGFEDLAGLAENERAWIDGAAAPRADHDVWIVGPSREARQDLTFALERLGVTASHGSVEADVVDDFDGTVRAALERAAAVCVVPRAGGRPTPGQLVVIERATAAHRRVLFFGDAGRAKGMLDDDLAAGLIEVTADPASVAAVLRSSPAAIVPQAPPPEDPLARYLAAVRTRHRNLVPFFTGARSGLLAEVYVELVVREDPDTLLAGARKAWTLADGDQPADPQEAEAVARYLRRIDPDASNELVLDVVAQAALLLRHRRPSQVIDRTHYAMVAARNLFKRQLVHGPPIQTLADHLRGPHRRWLVLGEPGAGKSTLIRHLCHEAAGEPDGPVPVFLSLARHGAHKPDPLLAAATEAREVDAGLQPELTRAALAAQSDRLWLFLDGMDEVPLADMEAVVAWIRGLHKRPDLANAAIVVTSRPVAVEKHGLGEGFERVTVQPLQQPAQRRLLDNLLGEDDARAVWGQLEHRPSLRSMASNPLLLTLIAMIGREEAAKGAALPSQRARLYAASVQLLLDRGYCLEPRGVKDRVLARELLRELALRLHETGQEAWPREALAAAVWAVLEASSALARRFQLVWDSPDRFLDDVGHNAGVLGPHDGPGAPWRFLHRSLREFLVAERLSQGSAAELKRFRGQWVKAIRAAEAAANAEAKQAGQKAGRRKAKAPPAEPVDPARWGEVYALLCGLVKDPQPYLDPLRALARDIALRALMALDELAPAQALAFLLSLRDADPDEVMALFDRLEVPAKARVALLDEAVAPTHDPHTLGVLWSLRAWLAGPPEREAFFARAGRPVTGAPAVDVVRVDRPEQLTFWMGSAADVQRDDFMPERPKHRVSLTPFGLSRAPITNGQYEAFGHAHPFQGLEDHPVCGVGWYEATAFAAWMGGRLPTEAEWECACRAGTSTLWSCGDDEADLSAHAWFDQNSDRQTHPVGEKLPNPWGFVDLHGNVWEWCADSARSYDAEDQTDPVGDLRPGADRVLRGGSAWNVAVGCRSAIRGWSPLSDRYAYIGLRVAFP